MTECKRMAPRFHLTNTFTEAITHTLVHMFYTICLHQVEKPHLTLFKEIKLNCEIVIPTHNLILLTIMMVNLDQHTQ